MNYYEKCYYIYNMQAQLCNELVFTDNLLQLMHSNSPLNNGNIKAGTCIYACLVYDHCRVITIVTSGPDSEVINLIFSSDKEYNETISFIRELPGFEISNQDSKLISYARSISEKLRSGIAVSIFDSVKKDDYITCPNCGVQNSKDSGFPFCLECGEPL